MQFSSIFLAVILPTATLSIPHQLTHPQNITVPFPFKNGTHHHPGHPSGFVTGSVHPTHSPCPSITPQSTRARPSTLKTIATSAPAASSSLAVAGVSTFSLIASAPAAAQSSAVDDDVATSSVASTTFITTMMTETLTATTFTGTLTPSHTPYSKHSGPLFVNSTMPYPTGSRSGRPSGFSTSMTSTGTASAPSGSLVALYYQCGGLNYAGSTTCVEGSVCKFQNPYYSQCVDAASV